MTKYQPSAFSWVQHRASAGTAHLPLYGSGICLAGAGSSTRSGGASLRAGDVPGPVGQVGEQVLDDGVVAVLGLGMDHLERGVGEDRAVAPDAEQFNWPVAALWLRSLTWSAISRAGIA